MASECPCLGFKFHSHTINLQFIHACVGREGRSYSRRMWSEMSCGAIDIANPHCTVECLELFSLLYLPLVASFVFSTLASMHQPFPLKRALSLSLSLSLSLNLFPLALCSPNNIYITEYSLVAAVPSNCERIERWSCGWCAASSCIRLSEVVVVA
jgi:hypothetical protein